jgi:hypothetical protein
MHNAQTDSEQQAINGVEDSLPGYKKQFIYFNGHIVGYKMVKDNPSNLSVLRTLIEERDNGWTLKKLLKWNW